MTRLAVVTGCSRGIGRMVTETLLDRDWAVIGLSRTESEARANLYWFACDVAAPDVVEDILASAGIEDMDALVHCAGVRGPYGPLAENDPEAWAATISTNLLGTYRTVRACLPRLHAAEDGRILLFSGGGAFGSEPGYSAYAATKGATVSLMETLAAELAGTSVAVNCVAPGFIATDIHKGTPHEGKPDDPDAMGNVGACVLHLLSPATRGLTGRTVSAQWDDWRSLSRWTLPNIGAMGTRDRRKIERLQSTLLRRHRAV